MSTSISKKREKEIGRIYIRDIRDIRSSKRSESNPEIQSLNMFKSGILNIRKVRSESNIKLFEYFGQPSSLYK